MLSAGNVIRVMRRRINGNPRMPAVFIASAKGALGLIIYAVCRKRYQSDEAKEVERLIMEEEIPTPQERQKMDKEFKIWRTVVTCAVVIAVVAYVIPFIAV